MRQRKARLAGLLVVATASTAVLTSGSAAAAPVGQPAPTLGALTRVTLVTGDVVTLEATCTLRTTATTSGRLSTRVDAEWTFRSGHVTGLTPKPVPALAVRLAPNLDDHNAAPTGKRFRIPIHVQRNGVEQPGQVNTPTVEISYDDGQTWQTATLTNRNSQWQAEVHHPKGAQFASLRWSISDNDGNAAKATIIRAYALK